MVVQNTNIGNAFPLEALASDLSRNQFNYQSILNGLIEWDSTTEDSVVIRLTKDSDPWYEDLSIPSKKATFELNTVNSQLLGNVKNGNFAMDSLLDLTLYGGSSTFIETIFTDANVNIADDSLSIIDDTNSADYNAGDTVIFELGSTGATIPGGLTVLYQYVIKSIVDEKVTLYESDGTTSVIITTTGSGTFVMKKLDEPLMASDDPGDIATFRTTVKHNGDANWNLNYYQLIQPWSFTGEYRAGNIISYGDTLYKVVVDHENPVNDPDAIQSQYELLIKPWIAGSEYKDGQLVSYTDSNGNTNLYKAKSISISNTNPEQATFRFTLYAGAWVTGTKYAAGSYVFYGGNPYINTEVIESSTKSPVANTEEWELAVILPVPTVQTFDKSTVIKWQLNVDVTNFILGNINESDGGESTILTDISIDASIRTKEPASIYQRSTDIFPTSNYAYWPFDKTSIWNSYDVIGDTDTSIPITDRQNYSAVMIYNHVDPVTAKTVNWINYDGPDLDQGLCIYLTVENLVAGVGPKTCVATPEDGFTYDFYFRIWPNASYTEDITRDHIINKAHIYVYSAPDAENIKVNKCGEPIAKFSMARSTNFYLFGENVAIPDKPVCYRATFMYSKMEGKWITLDYYQLPDHIFMGPVGFIDPQNPGNLELNNEVVGDINPNAQNIGYETGAFPLFQDPFSDTDLSPVKLTSVEDLENFQNRLI